jgi:hypothetical protein
MYKHPSLQRAVRDQEQVATHLRGPIGKHRVRVAPKRARIGRTSFQLNHVMRIRNDVIPNASGVFKCISDCNWSVIVRKH